LILNSDDFVTVCTLLLRQTLLGQLGEVYNVQEILNIYCANYQVHELSPKSSKRTEWSSLEMTTTLNTPFQSDGISGRTLTKLTME